MALARRLDELEQRLRQRAKWDPRPDVRSVLTDDTARELASEMADLLFGDGVSDPLPRDHPEVRAAWARLESRLHELRAAAPFGEKHPQNPRREVQP